MDTSSPDPALVGKVFVKQYYTQMHRDPSQLHRFYLEQSSFVHGGSEIGSENPVIGQKLIHDKIESLNLRQVHAKIKQVDSHATLGNGIVVQVTGELSTGGRPMRAFVQTFVLAPESPKKYYVHNDMFRYQDDDLSESETNEAPGEVENPGGLMDGVEEYPVISPITPEVGKVGGTEQDGGLFTSQGSGSMDLNEVHEVVTGGWDQFEDSAHLRQNGLPDELDPQVIPSENYSVEPSGHVTGGGDQGEMALGGGDRYSPQDMQHKDDKNLSWAGRLSKQAQSSSQNHPLNSMNVSGSQALPQREPRARRSEFPRTPDSAPNHVASAPKEASKRINSSLSRDAPDTWQIFVGGLPPQVSEADIKQVFSEYDSIAEIRVNPKNFAFVVFKGPEPVEKIMSLKESFQLRGKHLNIEPKRPSTSRGGPGGFRGGERNRGFGGGGGGGVGNKGGRGGSSGGGGGKPNRR